ncbi:MAG: GNAT family N-acetyltransferase [Erysipelotrichaceae bacterium]|nr:GNAT family N-acetyltransferase [Erysipelotrichaceae bacterium]
MALNDYINDKPVIATQRLIIRPMNAGDVPALRKWLSDKSIYTYWGKGPSKDDRDPALMFEKQERPAKSFHLGMEEKQSGQIIGDLWVYLIENDRMASVAIRVSPACQNNGYGSEALGAIISFCFANTELQRLWAQVDVRNLPCQRIMEKCGFTKEGLIRQGKMVSSWCDYYIYGILKSDLSEAVSRISEMERLFDLLSSHPEATDETRQAARKLADYLDSGRWLADYQLDELGMLPKQLKRGVLSQDGLYELLCEDDIRELLSKD